MNAQHNRSSEPPPRFSVQRRVAVCECLGRAAGAVSTVAHHWRLTASSHIHPNTV